MKIANTILFLVLAFVSLCAQQTDSSIVQQWYTRAQAHLYLNNLDSCIYLGTMALDYHEQRKDRQSAADCRHLLAKAYFQKKTSRWPCVFTCKR